MSNNGWIGVDLDGTLAEYDGWRGIEHIGAPVYAMVERVKRWITEGRRVKIFTARIATVDERERFLVVHYIWDWCSRVGLPFLEITCLKDMGMIELWDDRCVAVEPNTGKLLSKSTRGLE